MKSFPSPNRKKLVVRPELLICLILVITTLALYNQVKSFDFINYDTPAYVTENKPVLGGLTIQGIRWAFTTFYMSNWHPITWMSHMLDVNIYSLYPGGHHTTNLLIHICNALLLFYILHRSTGKILRSGLVAGMFALHPLHIQSVAWVAERKDLLSTFFFFLTILSYMYYIQKQGLLRYIIILLIFSLGLMSKPMIVTLPFVLLLLDYWPLKRIDAQQKIPVLCLVDKIPLFLLSAVSSVITIYAQKASGAMASFSQLPLTIRAGNALIAYVTYIVKAFLPLKLAIIYPYPSELLTSKVILSLSVLIVITVISLRYMKKTPWYAVGWFWFIGTLVPVIGIIQVGRQSMADRYTYIPLIGVFIILAWGIAEFLKKYHWDKKYFVGIAIILLTVYSTITWKELSYWRNSALLFGRALEVTENNFIAHNNYGTALVREHKFAEASKHFAKATQINPNDGDGYLNYGLSLAALNKPEEAIKQYQNALRIIPNNPVLNNNLANALYRVGNNKQAIQHYLTAIKFKPDYAEPYNNLGALMARQGNVELAIKLFQSALKYNPNYQAAKNNLRNIIETQNITQ